MDKHTDEDVARLLRHAGKRVAPPADMVERVRANVHGVWREELARRRQRRLFAVAASVLALAFGGWWVLQSNGGATPQVVASVERSAGGLALLAAGDPDGGSSRPAEGTAVSVGDQLETDSASGAVFHLAGDRSAQKVLRLAPDTRIVWVAPRHVRLLGGQLYFDAGAGTPEAGNAMVIEAAGARIQHVGTRFLVALTDRQLDVKVRDGTVRIEAAGEIALLQKGEQGTLGRNESGLMPVQRLDVGSSGEDWYWVDSLAPRLELEAQSLLSVLQRAAHEGGLALRFESAELEREARGTVLHGPSLVMPPRQAIDAVLSTTGFLAMPDGDGSQLLVRRR